MADRRLYIATVPESALGERSGEATTQSQLARLAGLDGAGTVTDTGTEPGEIRLDGQFRGTLAERLTTELVELLTATQYDALAFYTPSTDSPDAGYYTAQNVTSARIRPQVAEATSYRATLVREGTRASHRRAVKTNDRSVVHDFGTDTTIEVGIPATASKVEWVDYEQSNRQSASPAATRQAEFGAVDVYDVADAPYSSRPYLVYDLPYADAGNVDVAVYDTYGDDRTNADGVFLWQSVFVADHEFRGELIVDNGLRRLRVDETTSPPTLSAEAWDDAGDEWTTTALGSTTAADTWDLWDADLVSPGAAQTTLQLTFEKDDGTRYSLNAIVHRGWPDVQFVEPTESATPQGLVDLLEPIAAATLVDPQAERTLISREDLRR